MPVLEGNVGLSADSWLAWDEETIYGTPVAVSGSSEFSLFQSESLRGQVTIQIVPNISSAHRDLNQTYIGSEIVEGDIQVAVAYEGLETLLLHMFGALNNGGGGVSGTFIRDFDLASRGRYQDTNSPSLSMHVSRGIVGSGVTNPTVFTYEGCVVDGFDLTCTRDGALLLTITFFGQTETISTGAIVTSFPTAPVANGTECVVSWGAGNIPVTDFTISARRAIDRDRFFLGTTQTAEPPMGQYEITVSANTEWDNENRNGTDTLREDFRARTARTLRMRFTSVGSIPATSQKYEFDLLMDGALITAFPPNVSAVGRVVVPMTFTAFDDPVSDPPTGQRELRLHQIAENTFVE